MNKNIKSIMLLFLLLISFTGCTMEVTSADTAASKAMEGRNLKILTTNPIIKNMIDSLSGDHHETDCLVKNAEDMKGFTPDMDELKEKNYNSIFYMGSGYEPFMEYIINTTDRNKTDIINISRGIDILRYKEDKLDSLNYYYLTNSGNFQIALFSVKNALQEMDWARTSEYDEKFEKISRELDAFQKELRQFAASNKDMVFVSDNDFTAYICQEYHEPHKRITDYRREMEDPATSKSSSTILKEKALFLYTEEASLKKYADDIVKYRLKPVKIILYDYSLPMTSVYRKNFENIRKAVED